MCETRVDQINSGETGEKKKFYNFRDEDEITAYSRENR